MKLGSSYKRFLIRVLLPISAVVGFFVLSAIVRPPSTQLLPLISQPTQQPTPPYLMQLQQTFKALPMPAGTQRIHQRYYGQPKCTFAGTMALYATNGSWEDILKFYREVIKQSAWTYGGEWTGQGNQGEPTQWGLSADWQFQEGSHQQQHFTLLIDESKDTSELWYSPKEATRKALTAGSTVYIIQITYTEDPAVSERECPPGVGQINDSNWWEISDS